MGVGVCVNAACDCFEGYTGPFCEQCAPGYHLSARGACAPISDPCQSANPSCSNEAPLSKMPFGNATELAACSSHGVCVNNSTCKCDIGSFGRQCATRGCPLSWTSEQCACCPSGVFSRAGECCAVETPGVQPALDVNGTCCASGHVDACGARLFAVVACGKRVPVLPPVFHSESGWVSVLLLGELVCVHGPDLHSRRSIYFNCAACGRMRAMRRPSRHVTWCRRLRRHWRCHRSQRQVLPIRLHLGRCQHVLQQRPHRHLWCVCSLLPIGRLSVPHFQLCRMACVHWRVCWQSLLETCRDLLNVTAWADVCEWTRSI